jgi:hypothetical protein
MYIRRSWKAEVYWWWLIKCTFRVQLLSWRWTPMIAFCVTILWTSIILMYQNHLNNLIGVGLHVQLKLRRLFGLSEFHFFPYPAWGFKSSLVRFILPIWKKNKQAYCARALTAQAQVPNTLYVLSVCESSIRTYINGACWITSICNFTFKIEFWDLERSRSTGEDLVIVLCGYNGYHEDELRW